MKIEKFSLGQLQANCYFLIQDKKCLIIDPADEADFILETVQRENLELVGLVATHGHFDHIMAAGEIQLSYDIPFYIHPKDAFLVNRLEQTAKYFLGYEPAIIKPRNIKDITKDCAYSKLLSAIFSHFQLIHTPGHTPGSCSLFFGNSAAQQLNTSENDPSSRCADSPIVFTGDTLFKQGIGRYDFSYSNYEDLQASLEMLFQLPEETIVYSGHGEETIIANESKVT